LSLPQLLLPCWWREHLRIQGSSYVPLRRIPGELDLGDRYYFNVLRASLLLHLLLLLLVLASLRGGRWGLELLKEEAPTPVHLGSITVISVPSDELF
jgi:hypothetical protein